MEREMEKEMEKDEEKWRKRNGEIEREGGNE